jgi:hypothetical protein
MKKHVTFKRRSKSCLGSNSKGRTPIRVFLACNLKLPTESTEAAVYNPLYYQQTKVSGGQAFGQSLGWTAGRRSFRA